MRRASLCLLLFLTAILIAGCASKPDDSAQAAAGETDILDYGPLPEGYRKMVHDFAEDVLSELYKEADSHQIYVDTEAPVPKKLNMHYFGWSGKVALQRRLWLTDKHGRRKSPFSAYDVFDYYLRDEGDIIYLVQGNNDIVDLEKLLLNIGTLGMARTAAPESMKDGSDMAKEIIRRTQAALSDDRLAQARRFSRIPLRTPGLFDIRVSKVGAKGTTVEIVCTSEEDETVYDVQFNDGELLSSFDRTRDLGLGDTIYVRTMGSGTPRNIRIVTARGTLVQALP